MKDPQIMITSFQAKKNNEEALSIGYEDGANVQSTISTSQIDAGALSKLMQQLGTNLWRMKQKMIDAQTGTPMEEMRRVYRHVESSWDALAEQGFEIRDFTQMKFDPGLMLRVIAFQPIQGLHTETIIETIKPGIYYQNQCIQMGEVIVGTPAIDANSLHQPTGGSTNE